MTESTGVRDDSSVREDRVTSPKVLVENQKNNDGGGGAVLVPVVSKLTQPNRAAARWAILRSAIIESSQKQVHQTCDQQQKSEFTPIPQPAAASTDRQGYASEGSIHRFAGFGLLQRQRIPRHKVALLKKRLTTITLAMDDQKESLIEALECSLLALSALRPDNWIWQFAVKSLSGELLSSLCEEIQGNENLKLMLGKVEERLQQHQSNPKQRLRLKLDQCCWEETSKDSSTASNTKTLKVTLAPFYPSHGMFQYTLPSFSSNEQHTGSNVSRNESDDDQLRNFLFIKERLHTTTKKTLKELTTHHHNQGVDNTGNVCVWDSEQTLAYTLREHAALGNLPWLQDCQKENETDLSILELGCGMAGLAGLSILQSLVDQQLQHTVIENAKIRLWMTDGHPQAVQNNQVHAYLWKQLHGSSPDLGDPILCRVLPWSIEPPTFSLPKQQQMETIPPCNVALVSDCTHFQVRPKTVDDKF